MRRFVRKLTLMTLRRQRFVAAEPLQRLLCCVFGLFLFGNSASGLEQQWQPTADISAAAAAHVRKLAGKSAANTTVRAGSLDPRHRMPLCDAELESFMRRGTRIAARTIVGVRCSGSKPWKVYVPVDVIVTATVFTASRSLPRDHLLTAADLATAERDVSRLVSGYVSDKNQLIGQRLKQQLIAGRIITPSMLQADFIVRRGQTVTLTAAGGGINVSMVGKALMDGAINQRIRVENTNSGRVIEGIVRSREEVEILLPTVGNFFNAKPKVLVDSADTQVSNNDR